MMNVFISLGIGLVLGGATGLVLWPTPFASAPVISIGLPMIVIPVAIRIFRWGAKVSKPYSDEQVNAAIKSGRLALARVDRVSNAFLKINQRRFYHVEMTVQPVSGTAFRTTRRIHIPSFPSPYSMQGTYLVVAVIVAGQPDVELLPQDPNSMGWTMTVPPAELAGEILTPNPDQLTSPTKETTSFLGSGKDGRTSRVLVYIALVLVGMGLTLLVR